MEIVDKYLNILQEVYTPSIAISNIHGDFQNDWTECYNSKCTRDTDNKYAKNYCKTECKIQAANSAITRVNAETSNCAGTRDPKRCLDSLKSAVESYREKIKSAREMQDKISAREAEFRRLAAGAGD